MEMVYTSKALKKEDRRANKSVNRELIPLRRGDSERFVRIKKEEARARRPDAGKRRKSEALPGRRRERL